MDGDGFGGYGFCEGFIVFYEDHSGFIGEDGFFDLHTGKHIDVVEGLIPNVNVGFFTKALGD